MMLSGIGYFEEEGFLVAQVEQQHQQQLAGGSKIATGPLKSHRNPSGVCTCSFPHNNLGRRFSRRYWSLLPRGCTTSCAPRWFQADEAVLLLGWAFISSRVRSTEAIRRTGSFPTALFIDRPLALLYLSSLLITDGHHSASREPVQARTKREGLLERRGRWWVTQSRE